MNRNGIMLSVLVLIAAAAPSLGGIRDNLDTPSQMSKLVGSSPLLAITRAGDRLVAVGQRGHILYSDDGGKSWVQSTVPVSSDLNGVHFPTPKKGWAVGHDGVVLASGDGGVSWTKQLDGRQANRLLVASLERKSQGEKESATDGKLSEEAKRYSGQGPDMPFLDVWFADEKSGYVVGAFNLVFKTMDGGRTWESWFDRTDNPSRMHLNAIRPVGGALYIVGEGGMLLKLDPARQRFVSLRSPYNGSFFGVVGKQGTVLAYGLRGNVFRSDNRGATWQKVNTGVPAAIVGGAVRADGALVLVSQSGQVLISSDDGRSFRAVPLSKPMPAAGVVDSGKDKLVLVGLRGTRTIETNQP